MNDFARTPGESPAAWLARLERIGREGVAARDRPRYDACFALACRLADRHGDVRQAVAAVRARRCTNGPAIGRPAREALEPAWCAG